MTATFFSRYCRAFTGAIPTAFAISQGESPVLYTMRNDLLPPPIICLRFSFDCTLDDAVLQIHHRNQRYYIDPPAVCYQGKDAILKLEEITESETLSTLDLGLENLL